MKVRMKVGMSGTHNGEPWPAYGELADVDDALGEQLIAKGLAESSHAGTVTPAVETENEQADDDVHTVDVEERPAPVEAVETRPATTRQTPKKRK